jgi:pimeloyl-ACP methyl ester carboxylesterase
MPGAYAVDGLERFDFGGPAQWALVRGQQKTSPVLLVVQAGPGLPLIQDAPVLARKLGLEERFRVVYWDQRGTGKSFDVSDRAPLTLEALVDDVRKMVRALCERFGVSAVDVVGFSFGASLALLACEDESLPVRSLTCAGPDVNLLEAERFALAFAVAEAERRGSRRALRQLGAIGAPPHADPKHFMTRVQWVANFGGVYRGMTFGGITRETLLRLWRSRHYTLAEMFRALKAVGVTQERMLPALQGLDLLARPLHPRPPVAIFQGRFDAAAPPALAAQLARHIGAELVWFEASAHVPYEEEPARFREELFRFVSRVSQ